MERSNAIKTIFNIISNNELTKKSAIHEAGHATAIYFGNKHKQLPFVSFQIHLNNTFVDANTFNDNYSARIKGGRLIKTLPCSIDEATHNFSPLQKHAYLQAFEADMINLLAGPLAEANYVALRDNELINPRLIDFNTLDNYGGYFDLSVIRDYLACFTHTSLECETKIKELFLAAFHFVSNYDNWRAIRILANYILAQNKAIIDYEEISSVLDASIQHFSLSEIT